VCCHKPAFKVTPEIGNYEQLVYYGAGFPTYFMVVKTYMFGILGIVLIIAFYSIFYQNHLCSEQNHLD